MTLKFGAIWPKNRKERLPRPLSQSPTLGERIKYNRLTLKWSADDLARHLGVSAPHIYKIEKDDRSPKLELLKKIKLWLEEEE